jgi:hypothetical protein
MDESRGSRRYGGNELRIEVSLSLGPAVEGTRPRRLKKDPGIRLSINSWVPAFLCSDYKLLIIVFN